MLFLQMMTPQPQLSPSAITGLVVLGGVLAFLVLLGLLNSWRKRQISHIERMRAMELGYILPERPSRWAPAYCVVLGAGVPIATFLITWFAWMNGRNYNDRNSIDMWIAPIVVSGIAIIGSTVVAGIVLGRSDRSTQPERLTPVSSKPPADAESLEFGGRIGHG